MVDLNPKKSWAGIGPEKNCGFKSKFKTYNILKTQQSIN
jgi:hypothetical protein